MPLPLFSPRGSALNPLTVFGGPNVLAWLRADLGTTYDGSNGVIAVPDQTGNGRHAAQVDPALRPIIVPNGGPGGNKLSITSGPGTTLYLAMAAATGVDMTGKDWAVFGTFQSQTNPGSAATFWSSITTPASGSITRLRRDSGTRLTYLVDSAVGGSTFLTVVNPDGNPPPIWLSFLHTQTAAGVRNMYVWGDLTNNPVQPGTNTTTNTSGFGCQIAEGYIFRGVAGAGAANLNFFELGFLQSVPSASQRTLFRNYLRGYGVDT